MNAFTIKWYTKFITSLLGYTPQLKVAMKLKKEDKWHEYKPFVDKHVKEWLTSLIDLAGVKFVVKGAENVHPTTQVCLISLRFSSMLLQCLCL